ncbi:MAG TPA: hypothetical protein VIL35_02640 [Vicinamibacterales bacterium]
MAKDENPRKPSALWKAMTEEQRRRAAEAFWTDEESTAEQTEVMLLLARKLNFRYKSIQAMARERKVAHLIKLGGISEAVAGRLLVTYHLATQRPMMSAFLDALGIAHENGLISDDEMPAPEPEKLAAAAAAITAGYPAEDVRLYFSTLLLQDPETWGGLAEHLPPQPGPA